MFRVFLKRAAIFFRIVITIYLCFCVIGFVVFNVMRKTSGSWLLSSRFMVEGLIFALLWAAATMHGYIVSSVNLEGKARDIRFKLIQYAESVNWKVLKDETRELRIGMPFRESFPFYSESIRIDFEKNGTVMTGRKKYLKIIMRNCS